MLDSLEAEAIEIIREGSATSQRPVLLYSIGKDSSVMLRLAQKAFWPAPVPFPMLHVDTTWKFREMIAFRDATARSSGIRLLVHRNSAALSEGINCFDHGSEVHTDRLKTEALRQALDLHGFDVAFGGARRDEEASRAKERVFSVRAPGHRWDPRVQRPELWNLYNTRLAAGQTMRVFPLSNWTESDVWQYILRESIPVVPLYFARTRPVVRRDGLWIMVDDERMRLRDDEQVEMRRVRFRTLGCYPLTAAIESEAANVAEIVDELASARTSERVGRLIDRDAAGSMERKKQEGYF
ncbi:MAG: sulfate adenylyltransferase subunit CysD [Burkholderiales bacterium]|nr:sulfate adenylyltransferase subunit CysD [Burkholderiales bacterium]